MNTSCAWNSISPWRQRFSRLNAPGAGSAGDRRTWSNGKPPWSPKSYAALYSDQQALLQTWPGRTIHGLMHFSKLVDIDKKANAKFFFGCFRCGFSQSWNTMGAYVK